jgi:hypothetical protein
VGQFTGQGGALKVAVVEPIHAKGSKEVKIRCGGYLKRCFSLEAGKALIAKTIENKQDTSHRKHAVNQKGL